jgi:D-lactate dehydrogenase
MKVAIFSLHQYEKKHLEAANKSFDYQLDGLETRLTAQTARLAKGYEVISCFAHDQVDREALEVLHGQGVKLIALRSAGFNHVDLEAAREFGIHVVRVPAYSPYSVAEFAATLLMAINRKVHRSYTRSREMNFSLDGLEGMDLHGKTIGVIGTGKIGKVFTRIMWGFGLKILAYDPNPDHELVEQFRVTYCDEISDIYQQSDAISLHLPLTPKTHHLLNAKSFAQMKRGVFIVNTGRGGLIETKALIDSLKSGQIGAAGLDVYEEEEKYFFKNLSDEVMQDDQLARLLSFPNVLITSHQGFFTKEALANIARTTLENIQNFERGEALANEVSWSKKGDN